MGREYPRSSCPLWNSETVVRPDQQRMEAGRQQRLLREVGQGQWRQTCQPLPTVLLDQLSSLTVSISGDSMLGNSA